MIQTDPAMDIWIERARAVTVEEAAGLVGFVPGRGQARRAERAGSCPLCGGTDRFAINVAKNIWHCRGCGRGGKDGLGLVMHCRAMPFLDACELVAGPRPEAASQESPEARDRRLEDQAARLDQIRRDSAAKNAATADAANAYREARRAKAYSWWREASPCAGSAAEAYLIARGLDVPYGLRARYRPVWSLYDGETDDSRARVVHRGPALLLPIVRLDGVFLGTHFTWFDPDNPGEKIMVLDACGERVPAKKVQGSKKGGHIVYHEPVEPMTRLMIAEGFENAGSAYTALRRRNSPLMRGCGFWSAVDLGNLAGRALDRLTHPTETISDKKLRIRRVQVPGIVPDPESEAVAIPDSVSDLYLIGDGDSEPFRTCCAMTRAAERHRRPGRTVRVVMAPMSKDLNTWLRGL